jgi:hypothetical protein
VATVTATEIRGNQCAPISKYRENFGSMRAAMRLAGRNEDALRTAYLHRKSRTHRLSKQFKWDLAKLMTREGLEWNARGNRQVFLVNSTLKLRFKLTWQREHRRGLRWHFQKVPVTDCDYLLLVLMQENNTANELLLLTPTQYKGLRTWFTAEGRVGPRRIFSACELVEQLRSLSGKPR